jgi:hypothetical protein
LYKACIEYLASRNQYANNATTLSGLFIIRKALR